MRLRAHVVFVSALVAAAPSACARSAEERQLDEMRDTIDRVQEDRDRADQTAMGPDDGEPRVPGPTTPPPPPAAPARPAAPDTMRFGVADEPPPDPDLDTDDKTPRPSIRVVGSPRPAGRGWREGQSEQVFVADDGSEGAEAPADARVSAPSSSAIDPEAKRAYDAALSLVTAKQYDRALDALAAFLVRWPDHPYADNALYWRGECYFARGDYARAAEQFDGVLARFPAGNKAPDALLKLGICHQKLGEPGKARECFARLAQQYPGSEAARRAPGAAATSNAAQPPARGLPVQGPAPEGSR